MDWTQITTLLIGFLGFIIANFGMFLWARSESKDDHRMALDLIIAIKEESKDFHGRLERQDAEFKARLCAIEERRKK